MGNKANKSAREALVALYGARCMLTGIKTKRLTYHHALKKRAEGGDESVKNGALLINKSHEWLHGTIELNDLELYDLINECLDLYKKCKDKELRELERQFEEEVQVKIAQKVKRRK